MVVAVTVSVHYRPRPSMRPKAARALESRFRATMYNPHCPPAGTWVRVRPSSNKGNVAVMPVLIRLAVLILGLTVAAAASADQKKKDLENMLYLELKSGRVVIQLLPDVAPKHVARVKELARQKFYDGIVFHRVIPGFMAQSGDPTGTGTGGSEYPDLEAEFNDTNFGRGAVGMARSGDPDSGNSQWFICFDDCSFLNGDYTVWGQVIAGMEHVDAITRGEPPANPDKIIKMQVAADAEASN